MRKEEKEGTKFTAGHHQAIIQTVTFFKVPNNDIGT